MFDKSIFDNMLDTFATGAATRYASDTLQGEALARAMARIEKRREQNRKIGKSRRAYSFSREVRREVMPSGTRCDCGKLAEHLDHIIPYTWKSKVRKNDVLALTMGEPMSVPDFIASRHNAQALCADCNREKSINEKRHTGSIMEWCEWNVRSRSAKRGAISRGNNRAAFIAFASATYGHKLAQAERAFNVAQRKGLSTRAFYIKYQREQDRFQYACQTGKKSNMVPETDFLLGKRLAK